MRCCARPSVPLLALAMTALVTTGAAAQGVPAVNDCKQESLTGLSSETLLVGDSVQIQSPAGPVTYTARPGESVWGLCALTLRAAEAFQPRIVAAETEAGTHQTKVAGLEKEVTDLRARLARAEAAAAAAPAPSGSTSVAPTPAQSGSTAAPAADAPGMTWLPWGIAALAVLAAAFFLVRSLSLSRRLSLANSR